MASVTQVRIETVTPVHLVEQARKGLIRIPTFQRSFRWRADDVEALFDSVLRRYPVGNLLLWQRPAPAEPLAIGPLLVDAPAVPLARAVVDGQQRITTLVGALCAPADVTDPRFAVHVDLTTRQVHATLRPASDRWLPIRVAASTQDLLAWQRSRAGALTDAEVEAADEVAGALREYAIPTYVVEADDEREIRVVFDRVNHAGRRLTGDEVFDALHGMQGVSEAGSLESLSHAVAASGFGVLDGRQVRRSLLALRGPDIFRDTRGEFTDDDDRRAAFGLTERVLLDVVELVRSTLAIPHAGLLPYPSVLPLLAAHVHRFGPPGGRTATLLRRWVWRTAALGANPANDPNTARRTLRALRESSDAAEGARVLLATAPEPRTRWAGPDLSRTAMKDALPRVNVLGMLSLAPRRLDSAVPGADRELAPAELFDGAESPLLPLLPPRLAGERAGSLANRLLHPATGMASDDVRAALLDADREVRVSHAVDDDVVSLLREGAYPEALALRALHLVQAIEHLVDDRAEWGALDGPTAAELMRPA